MRHCPHISLPLQHCLMQDAHIGGYKVPKGTQVFYFGGSHHRNPEHFKDPDAFKPERFLNESTGRFTSDEKLMYFGVGKRRCVGEIMGKMESYVYAAMLLQRFKILPVDDYNPPIVNDYVAGINMHIVPQKVRLEARF